MGTSSGSAGFAYGYGTVTYASVAATGSMSVQTMTIGEQALDGAPVVVRG